jgi:hypothetical protein
MTHAVYDQHCLGNNEPFADSEVVAYVAEHIYCVHAQIPFHLFNGSDESEDTKRIHRAAHELARVLSAQPGATLTERVARPLILAINAHPQYRGRPSIPSDGIA